MKRVRRNRSLFFILLFLLSFSYRKVSAQEPLMAKSNKAITISYGVANFNKILLDNHMETNALANGVKSYDVKFSNPLAVTFDYAISDYTTIGLGVSYYSFQLKENRDNISYKYDLESRGYRMNVHLRGMRYLVQGPKSVFYLFAGAGIRIRSVSYNTSNQRDIQAALINSAPEASPKTYFPGSFEAGIGTKILVTRRIGLSGEFGFSTSIAQLGLFYSLKNKWRRTNDHLGW